MSEPPPPANSSLTSGTGQLGPDGKPALRPHPPRLQHSPSMPNIWFPPHSGPVPPRLAPTCDLLKRPPTPPPCGDSNVSEVDSGRSDPSTLSTDPKAPADGVAEEEPSAPTTKANRRRRIPFDEPAVLLTPPLTPSSSIRTAASIESSVSHNAGVESNVGHHFTDPDTVSTRFLLIRNVSRKVTSEVLQFAILRSLAASNLIAPRSTAGTVPSGPRTNQSAASLAPTIDSIKGVLLRYHESHGIAILAFYDVRQAKSAQVLLSTPANGGLADCVAEECKFDGQRAWLDCSFVTAQDLMEMVGNSAFLAETQGSFVIAADANGVENAKREINVATLINVLKAYGGVRSFGLAKENQQAFFCVEYYDVREANAAYPALDGQVFFGMRLSILGRISQSLESQEISETTESESCVPFPRSCPEKAPVQSVIRFESAGQKSQIRERFLFIDTAGKGRPRSASAGHETLEGSLNPSIPHNSSGSPPYFYTSPPTSPSSGVPHWPRTPDSHNRRASNHLFFDAVGRSCDAVSDQLQHTPKRLRSVSFNSVTGREKQVDSAVDAPLGVHDQDPGPPMDYCYAPVDRFPQPYYNGCASPHSFPYGYPPHPGHVITPGMGYPGCPPSPLTYGYEYDQPHMNMGSWTFEQAMMVPTLYSGFPYASPTVSPSSDYWQGPQTPSPQHTAYFHYPPLPPDSPPLSKLQPPPHLSFSRPVHLSSPQPPSVPPRPVAPSSGPPNSVNSAERNQLNLARIEDGQDTRTTVMIKNIPNKMSDKDLMAYIGSVCVRKIDFLYLRMDFQNGCNVGYAFVNFISVQDLLRFAKARLGEKWNMFSSEKVLQMSYANYQGKEALVEKFKNSCIMDERVAWQPKIFYSDGPEQGLPEPFPAPTHLRRKERSSYNRGPLYVPGTTGMQSSMSPHRRTPADSDRDRLMPSRHNERPRRLRDVEEQNAYSHAHSMVPASLKKPNKK
ncbi:RNA recognition motif 2-domain-containing protein [Mycena vitilis]|nr:RNA recognition motif 2-domain-containing protein [Mycena vitilis]